MSQNEAAILREIRVDERPTDRHFGSAASGESLTH